MMAPASARANDLDVFGVGARQIALGGAVTAFASDPTATYYNPAGLMNSTHLNLQIGYSFADYYLSFDSDRGGTLDSAAERIPDLGAVTLGLSTVLPPGDGEARFSVGTLIYLPTRRALSVEESTAVSNPQFVLYGGGRDRLAIYLGLGLRVTDWLSLGAGATIFADTDGQNQNNILSGNDSITFKQDASHDAAPVVGVLLEPTEYLSIGLTYRGEMSTKINFQSVTNGLADIRFESITFFSPHQVALGLAWDAYAWLTFLLDVTYYNWSGYEDAFIVATANGTLVGQRVDSGFKDTVVPRVGVEFEATDWCHLRFGYFYQPTPAPEARNFTNLIDNDKHVFSLGIGFIIDTDPYFRSDRPAGLDDATAPEGVSEQTAGGGEAATVTVLPAMGRGASGYGYSGDPERAPGLRRYPIVAIDLFAQYHFLVPRDHDKSNPADPIGDAESSGSIINFGIQLTLRF